VEDKPKRRKKNTSKSKPRQYSRSFNLPSPNNTGDKISVCKTFFLHTIRLKTCRRLTNMLIAKRPKRVLEGKLLPTEDRRGGVCKKLLIFNDVIIDHINSFHPTITHYTQNNAPNRRHVFF